MHLFCYIVVELSAAEAGAELVCEFDAEAIVPSNISEISVAACVRASPRS